MVSKTGLSVAVNFITREYNTKKAQLSQFDTIVDCVFKNTTKQISAKTAKLSDSVRSISLAKKPSKELKTDMTPKVLASAPKDTVGQFRNLEELNVAIQHLAKEVIQKKNVSATPEQAHEVMQVSAQLQTLRAIRAQYIQQLAEQQKGPEGSRLSEHTLLQVVTVAVKGGIVTAGVSKQQPFKDLNELNHAIRQADVEVFINIKEVNKNPQNQDLKAIAALSKERRSELLQLKERFEQERALPANAHLQDHELLQLVSDSLSLESKEPLAGSFGHAVEVTVAEKPNRTVRVIVEADNRGTLVIRQLLDQIGKGAESKVWLSEQTGTSKRDVTKEPLPKQVEEGENAEQGGLQKENRLQRKAMGLADDVQGIAPKLMVRYVQGKYLAFTDLQTGGGLAKTNFSQRTCVMLGGNLQALRNGTFTFTEAKKEELAERLANAAMQQTGNRNDKVDPILYEFTGDIGQSFLSEENYNKLATNTTSYSIKQFRAGKSDEEAKALLVTFFKKMLTETATALMEKQHATIDPNELFDNLSKGVQQCHKNNIIHRDIKPGNLLCSKENNRITNPRIADFGMALDLDMIRQNTGLPEGFTLGNGGVDRKETRKLLEKIINSPGESIVLSEVQKGIVGRLAKAGILEMDNEGKPVIKNRESLEKLHKHLEFTSNEENILSPGTRFYTFKPYQDAAMEYIRRGDFESYAELTKALDEMAAAVTFYQLATGGEVFTERSLDGNWHVSLTNEQVATMKQNMVQAGIDPAKINKIIAILTPDKNLRTQAHVDKLEQRGPDDPLPRFTRSAKFD